MTHSYNSPPLKINKNVSAIAADVATFVSTGNGVRMAISTSKIRNKTATVKNWVENGTRMVEVLTMPHSNGLFLVLLVFVRLVKIFDMVNSASRITTMVRSAPNDFPILLC